MKETEKLERASEGGGVKILTSDVKHELNSNESYSILKMGNSQKPTVTFHSC